MDANADYTQNDNRLDLLLFQLTGRQRFGINVLKVKEVIPCPAFTHVPQSHPAVVGVAQLRGEALTVVDLSAAIGSIAYVSSDSGPCDGAVIVTEFNRRIQGFLVRRVDRIVVCDWQKIFPPPAGSARGSYITGVAELEKELVEILDVERILGEVIQPPEEVASFVADVPGAEKVGGRKVLLVDDSSMARHQTAQTLDHLGVEYLVARDGKEALELLMGEDEGNQATVEMVISDIEMPEMDGYTLTREIRKTPALRHLYILLHTSLNGAINADRAKLAGADDILTKFVPEELSKSVVKALTRGHSDG
ncbi:chemotaxis protein [Endothiovibrio diazotrophicus]